MDGHIEGVKTKNLRVIPDERGWLMEILRSDDEIFQQFGQVYNIACGRRITINQLVDMINEILGMDVEPIYSEARAGDIKDSLADISKARVFGYEPKSDFKQELEETIRWFSNESV